MYHSVAIDESYKLARIVRQFWIVVALAVPVQADETRSIVEAILHQSCVACHNDETQNGDLNLKRIPWSLDKSAARERWLKVYHRVAAGEMPADKESLSDVDRKRLLTTLRSAIHRAERDEVKTHGRGFLRRLTRSEYENNLKDLLHLPDLDIVDHLPADREAQGFTKVARLLDLSRVQLAGYMDAAEAALQQAVASGIKPPKAKRYRFTGTDLFPATTTFGEREAMFFARKGKLVDIAAGDLAKMTPEQRRDTTLELALFRSATWPYYGYPRGFRAPRDGRYRVKFSGRAVRQLPGFRLVPGLDALPMSFRARQPSGPDVSGDVRETGGWMDLLPEAKVFETTVLLKKGETFEYSLLGLPVPFIRTDGGFFYDFPPMPRGGHRGAAFQWMELEGPLSPDQWPPKSHRLLFADLPIRPAEKGSALGIQVVSPNPSKDAKRLFQAFANRAARRPVSDESLVPFLSLVESRLEEGQPFAEAMLEGYQAFLSSAHVLYLTEQDADSSASHAFASRLSHFLWNSRPDDELLRLAGSNKLKDPASLRSQVNRLVSDARFQRFVAHFTDEWLDLRQLRRDNPDIRLYPEYRKDDYLVDSMGRETRAFFTAMVRDNLPITTVVDADFAYVNDRLAEHYGLARQNGSAMRRVALPTWSPYGGLLTHASILKLTSNGTTTSPVVRGAWVMEKLLGHPPPPPPKNIPAIAPDIRGTTTIRQQLAKHTEAASCASCHAKFDPVGFALENFDIMGAWRDRYRGLTSGTKITGFDRAGHPFTYHIGPEVDPSGTFLGGETFEDIHQLKRILKARPRQLAHNLLEHLAFYATGQPTLFADQVEMKQILDRCETRGYRVGDLVHELVASRIFAGMVPLAIEGANDKKAP